MFRRKTLMYIQQIEIDTDALNRADLPASQAYLRTLPLLRGLDSGGVLQLQLDSPVTFITGENGTGKSTLIEAAAVSFGFNPEGGSKNFTFSTSTRASHAELYRFLRLVKSTRRPRDGYFLRAESYFNVATQIERLDDAPGDPSPKIIGGYGNQSLHEQSHGESFLSLMQNRFFGRGLYMLDEPEAALSPTRLMTMLILLRDLTARDSQFLISTHSPILMAYPDAQIYEITESGIRLTPYTQTASYVLTKRFLTDPQSILETLLNESPLSD